MSKYKYFNTFRYEDYIIYNKKYIPIQIHEEDRDEFITLLDHQRNSTFFSRSFLDKINLCIKWLNENKEAKEYMMRTYDITQEQTNDYKNFPANINKDAAKYLIMKANSGYTVRTSETYSTLEEAKAAAAKLVQGSTEVMILEVKGIVKPKVEVDYDEF